MSVERAELGVDGNCGFALLGENTQEGEAEFIKIDYEAKDGLGRDVMGSQAERIAAQEALEKLQIRLNKPALSFYFGNSHPYGN